jgi:hypothetical protein
VSTDGWLRAFVERRLDETQQFVDIRGLLDVALETATDPSWSWTNHLTRARPSPRPPHLRSGVCGA